MGKLLGVTVLLVVELLDEVEFPDDEFPEGDAVALGWSVTRLVMT